MRTEAGRLRARLSEYYIGQGKDNGIVIELPKGGYVPVFRLREPASQPAPPVKKIRHRVWLVPAAVTIALAIAAIVWVQKTERFWRNPLEGARFQAVTDFDGTEREAAVSRDGKFVAFLSGQEGHTDVWVTQPGSGQFHNLTRGSAPELGNPSVRALGFSPDSSLVTVWLRKPAGPTWQIGIWAIPTLGGQANLYLEGVGEFDWSLDGSRLTYHTAARGRPAFRFRRHAASSGTTNLYRARGPAFSLSVVGARRQLHLLRPAARFPTNWTSGASSQLAECRNGLRHTMGA